MEPAPATGARRLHGIARRGLEGLAELSRRVRKIDCPRSKLTFGIDFSKPTVTAFTNVLWDAQVFYASNAFPSMLDWLVETIRYFAKRPDLQLVIRVHPAEVQNPIRSRQTVVEELARLVPELPPNVFVIPPTASANSYALARASNAAIIYGTKMGVELAYMGVPTIVAGESWARNKGVTLDATTREGYVALLDRLPLEARRADEAPGGTLRVSLLLQAHHPLLSSSTSRKALGPRSDFVLRTRHAPWQIARLDIVCDGILKGAPFIYPAEQIIAEGRQSH